MKTRMANVILGAMLVSLLIPNPVLADLPVVPGFTVEVYANIPSDPGTLSFAPDGTLYVGHGDFGYVSIYRVSPGGGPGSVSLFGDPVLNPDPVLYDNDGLISGMPGSVLTGGMGAGPSHITAIHPDGTAHQIWPPPPVAFENPSDMAFDNTGRFLFVDPTAAAVYQSSGENPTELFATPSDCYKIAIDSYGRMYVSNNDATIWLYDSGTLDEFYSFASTPPA